MQKHDLTHLETRIQEVGQNLARVADNKDFQELLTIIHRPGWTTPAEQMFALGLVNAMHSHTNTLSEIKQALLNGSRAVVAQ